MRKVTEVRGEAGTPSHSPALHPSSKSPLPRLSVQNTWPSADIPVSHHSSHMCPPATPVPGTLPVCHASRPFCKLLFLSGNLFYHLAASSSYFCQVSSQASQTQKSPP